MRPDVISVYLCCLLQVNIRKMIRGVNMYSAEQMGARMKELRKSRGYTQADIAELINCSESNYQKIETGKVSVSVPMFLAIGKVLETSIDYLARGDEAGIEKRIEKLLAGKSQEELEYVYRILYVLLSEMPLQVKSRAKPVHRITTE